MAARTRKLSLPDQWRNKIRISMLMNRLVDHAHGKVELSSTQVRALEIVLSKLVPTLSSVEATVENVSYVNDLSVIGDRIRAMLDRPIQDALPGDVAVSDTQH